MPHIQRVSDDTESPLRMLVITGSRPPAENAGDRNAFRATNGLENLKQTLAAFIPYRTGKDESDTHLSLATMNSSSLGLAPLNEVDTDRVTAHLHQQLGVRREPLVPVARRSPAKAWTTPPASPLPHISASVSMPPAFAPTPAKETR